MSHLQWGILRVAFAWPWAHCCHAGSQTFRYQNPLLTTTRIDIHPVLEHQLEGAQNILVIHPLGIGEKNAEHGG